MIARSSTQVTVRRIRPGDLETLAVLLADMERHYGSASPPQAAADLAATLVAAPAGGPHMLVAEGDGGTLLGFAICNEFVPAGGLSKGLYLKDIFVGTAGRSRGIGRVLLDHVAALARERGCTRVIWTTNASNTGAQKLYDAIGARREAKINYVVDGTPLDDMAARAGS